MSKPSPRLLRNESDVAGFLAWGLRSMGWNVRALTMLAALIGAASEANAKAAPQPAKPVDVARLYSGRWYEIARTPTKSTNGCLAVATDFFSNTDGGVDERDTCLPVTPKGREKITAGSVTILNPGENTKVKIAYTMMGFIPVARTFWMLDHAADYSWFIEADPGFKTLDILTRQSRPNPDETKRLTARAAQLGFDIRQLEFPPLSPAVR